MSTKNKAYGGEISKSIPELTRLGQKEGRHNRPAQDSAAPDVNEAKLKSEASSWLASEHHLFDHELTEVSRQQASSAGKFGEMREHASQLLSDKSLHSEVNIELDGFRSELVKTKVERLKAEAELKYFRAASNIHEEARYPASQILHLGWVAAVCVIEGAVNAFFYENANGLIGGAIVALAIAFVNTAFACGLGLGFRYSNFIEAHNKFIGWLCFAAFVCLTLFLNALFASFRSEYQLVADPSELNQVAAAYKQAQSTAIRFFVGEFRFQDHWSLILFFLSTALSVFAFYKGYTLDDRVPYHGAKTRVYRALVAAEEEVEGRLRLKVREMLNRRRTQVQGALSEPTTQINLLGKKIADLEGVISQAKFRSEAVVRDFLQALRTYREANSAIRATPAPAYFQEIPQLEVADFAAIGADSIESLKALQDKLRLWIEGVRPELSQCLNELQEHSSELLNRSFGEFVAQALAEAKTQIAKSTGKLSSTPLEA